MADHGAGERAAPGPCAGARGPRRHRSRRCAADHPGATPRRHRPSGRDRPGRGGTRGAGRGLPDRRRRYRQPAGGGTRAAHLAGCAGDQLVGGLRQAAGGRASPARRLNAAPDHPVRPLKARPGVGRAGLRRSVGAAAGRGPALQPHRAGSAARLRGGRPGGSGTQRRPGRGQCGTRREPRRASRLQRRP